jgi:hypothetical protein
MMVAVAVIGVLILLSIAVAVGRAEARARNEYWRRIAQERRGRWQIEHEPGEVCPYCGKPL